MLRKRILQAFLCSGAILSLFLIWQHVQFVTSGRVDSGLCSATKVFDCTAIEKSGFSSFFGVPTAAFGFLYFLGFLLFTLRCGSSQVTRNNPDLANSRLWNISALFSLVGIMVCLVLASISAFVIKGFCLGCTLVYVCTLASLITSMKDGFTEFLASCFVAFKDLAAIFIETFGDEPILGADITRKLAFLFLLVISPLTMWLPHYFATKNLVQNTILQYESSPLVELRIDENALADGPADAPLQLVMFTDFDCPSCKAYAPVLKTVLASFSGAYRLVYKHYPLGKCNPIMKDQKNFHANACKLAEMAQALGGLNRFATVGDELYNLQGQKDLYPSLKAIAEYHGIIYLDWVRETENPATKERIEADITEGFNLGLTSVPALFINGKYARALKPDQLGFVLQHALEQKLKTLQPAEPTPANHMHQH